VGSAVRERLDELAQRQTMRRRRTEQLVLEARLRLESVHHLYQHPCPTIICQLPAESRAGRGTALAPERTLPGTGEVSGSGDVLNQVQSVLDEVDRWEKDHWTEDDDRLLLCLQEAWGAATRKGYTLEDVITLLRFLHRPSG